MFKHACWHRYFLSLKGFKVVFKVEFLGLCLTFCHCHSQLYAIFKTVLLDGSLQLTFSKTRDNLLIKPWWATGTQTVYTPALALFKRGNRKLLVVPCLKCDPLHRDHPPYPNHPPLLYARHAALPLQQVSLYR